MKILDKLMTGLPARPVLVTMLKGLPIDFLLALGDLNRVIMPIKMYKNKSTTFLLPYFLHTATWDALKGRRV